MTLLFGLGAGQKYGMFSKISFNNLFTRDFVIFYDYIYIYNIIFIYLYCKHKLSTEKLFYHSSKSFRTVASGDTLAHDGGGCSVGLSVGLG